MSLKYDRIEYLLSQIDIADAVEALKNGKRNSKRNLYKFVYFKRINKQDYKEIVARFYKVNIRKKKREFWLFGYPLKEWTPVLFFFSIIFAIGILLNAVYKDTFWVTGSALYLALSFFVYYYSSTQDKEDKKYEIAKLKQEIRELESIRKSNEHIIELLEQETERLNDKISFCEKQKK